MQLFHVPASLLLALGILSLPSGSLAAGLPSAISFQKCYTASGTSSVKQIPTTTVHISSTFTYPIFVSSTPTQTITPSASTTTSVTLTTVTTTSNVPQNTDTITTTETDSTTVTSAAPTSTSISTVFTTTTTTTTVSATTIPTSNGFQPVLNTLPGAQMKKRSDETVNGGSVLARAAQLVQRGALAQCPKLPGKNKPLPKLYPSAVTCYAFTEYFAASTITKTATKTVTITGATPTSTVQSVSTITNTAIVTTPDAISVVTSTTTSTAYTTTTPSTTITTISTQTATAQTALSTTYAQCSSSSNNFAGGINGEGIVQVSVDSSLTLVNTPDTDQVSCCNSCAANPSCGATAFYPGFAAGSQCYNAVQINPGSGTCTQGGSSIAYYRSDYGDDQGYIISNGQCGEYNQAVQD